MPRGGRREGAGRHKGSRNKWKIFVDMGATAKGLTPLEFMQLGMQRAIAAGETELAVRFARALLPYQCRRLRSVRGEAAPKPAVVMEVVMEIVARDLAEMDLTASDGQHRLHTPTRA